MLSGLQSEIIGKKTKKFSAIHLSFKSLSEIFSRKFWQYNYL